MSDKKQSRQVRRAIARAAAKRTWQRLPAVSEGSDPFDIDLGMFVTAEDWARATDAQRQELIDATGGNLTIGESPS